MQPILRDLAGSTLVSAALATQLPQAASFLGRFKIVPFLPAQLFAVTAGPLAVMILVDAVVRKCSDRLYPPKESNLGRLSAVATSLSAAHYLKLDWKLSLLFTGAAFAAYKLGCYLQEDASIARLEEKIQKIRADLNGTSTSEGVISSVRDLLTANDRLKSQVLDLYIYRLQGLDERDETLKQRINQIIQELRTYGLPEGFEQFVTQAEHAQNDDDYKTALKEIEKLLYIINDEGSSPDSRQEEVE